MSNLHEILTCDSAWLAMLIISSGIVVIIGICGVFATIRRSGPELALNISSMIKDSPFVADSYGDSTFDAGERARRCKDMVVRYGDVRSDEDIGYIAIGTKSGSTGPAKLKSRRLYE